MLLTERADLVFEGMTIADRTMDAHEGILYLRGEYLYLHDHLETILAACRARGVLGQNFDVRIQLGAGAHICGEKGALIRSCEGLPTTGEKMRRLMHYGQVMQSHVLHFFHLSAPDLLFSFGSDHTKHNISEVIRQNPELGLRAVLMRKFGPEIFEATAGKKIHGTGAIPGGVNRNLDMITRDGLLAKMDQMLD